MLAQGNSANLTFKSDSKLRINLYFKLLLKPLYKCLEGNHLNYMLLWEVTCISSAQDIRFCIFIILYYEKKLFKNSICYCNMYIIKVKALYHLTAQKISLSLFWGICLHNFFFYKVTNIHKHIFIKMESPYATHLQLAFLY